MRYRNATPALNGDRVIQFHEDAATIVDIGVLHDAEPGNDFVNGRIVTASGAIIGACLVDCLHVEDIAVLLKEKGLDKRPVVR